MKLLNLILLLFIFTSCALFSSDNEEASKQTNVSKEAEDDFKAIERSQVKNHVENLHEYKLEESKNKASTPATKPEDTITVQAVKLKGNQNTLRELNQVLSYHCMKHRKRFSNIGTCHQKVNNGIDQCEKKHVHINADFVRCLKIELQHI